MSAGRVPSALHYAQIVSALVLCLLVGFLTLLTWGRNRSYPSSRGTSYTRLASEISLNNPARSPFLDTATFPSTAQGKSERATQVRVAEVYGRLPLSFEANRGQTNPQVDFLARGRGYTLFLTGNEAVLALRKPLAVSPQLSAFRNSKFEDRNRPTWDLQSEISDPNSLIPCLESLLTAPEARNSKFEIRNSSIDNSPASSVLRLKLVGANAKAKVVGLDDLPGKSNYFLGNDPQKWRTNVPNYARVRYRDVYPGIDLVFHGKESGVRSQESEGRDPKGLAEDRQLEYDWVVAPGADLAAIRLAVETGEWKLETGKSKSETGNWKLETRNSKLANPESRTPNPGDLRIDPNGDLVIAIDAGEVRFRKPVVYQELSPVNNRQLTVTKGEPQRTRDNGPRTTSNSFNRQSSIGNRQSLDGHYALKGANEVGFEVASYDPTKPLVIDPVLSYSTYLGGRGNDEAFGIAVDVNGNAYVTGMTTSADFPTSSGGFDKSCGSDGACNVDSSGNIFPDVFVTKLDRSGSALVYSTYLGGSGDDRGYAIAVDRSGNAYVAGLTSSNDFPTTPGAFRTTCGNTGNCGNQPYNYNDAFVTKLNRSGSAVTYSTYLGGSSYDFAYGIAVDASGNAYVTGATYSTDFPTANPFQATHGGGSYDAFVSKLNAAGTGLVYSTYLGGGAGDSGSAIAVDASGRAYVTGTTYSTDFPAKNAFQATRSGSGYSADAFVAKFQASGSALVYSTYLGGSEDEFGLGVATDSSGNAYVTGWTWSTDFPTANAFQDAISGTTCSNHGNPSPCPDAFVTKLNAAGSALAYSSYLGGSNYEYARAIAVDSAGNAYVAGVTWSTDFPIVSAFQAAKSGPVCASSPDLSCRDAFVAKLDPAGDELVYSTFLGGTGGEEADGIAVDTSGNAYVTGLTTSSDFPKTIGAYDTTCGTTDGCSSDQYGYPMSSAFVAKISPSDAPGVSVSSTSLRFPPQIVGSRSAPQTLRLNNTGSAPLAVTSIAGSGDFEIVTHTCGTKVEAGTHCSIQVAFRPTAEGVRFGNLTVTDNAGGGQHRTSLWGVGIGPRPKQGFSNPPPRR